MGAVFIPVEVHVTCFGRVVTPNDDPMYKANFGAETVPVFKQTHVGWANSSDIEDVT